MVTKIKLHIIGRARAFVTLHVSWCPGATNMMSTQTTISAKEMNIKLQPTFPGKER